MRISFVVGIISLLLSNIIFITFTLYEKYLYKKDKNYKKNKKYVGKLEEIAIILGFVFSAIFLICFILNIPFISNMFLDLMRMIFNF